MEAAMEPVYSDWKRDMKAGNKYELQYCPYCDNRRAFLMKRFVTNRDGETEVQFRVECPVCKRTGKTYLHESIAIMSWEGKEHDRRNPFLARGKKDNV